MRLAITHETRYQYSPSVQTAQHVAHLQPANTPCQQVLHHEMQIEPGAPVRVLVTRDLALRPYTERSAP